MSFGGHVQDMIERIKFNESQKKNRKKYYEKVRNAYLNSHNNRDFKPSEENISEERLEAIKENIRKEAKADKRKELTILIAIAVLLIVVIVLLIN